MLVIGLPVLLYNPGLLDILEKQDKKLQTKLVKPGKVLDQKILHQSGQKNYKTYQVGIVFMPVLLIGLSQILEQGG